MASEPPLILAFDTSAAHCAAVLVSGDRVLGQRDEAMARGQAERLIPLLEDLLAGAGHRWADLDGLAVVTGPGNFTGLRLAIAAARGLAFGLRIPAVGVSVFEALADGRSGAITVVLHDKRGTLRQRFRDGVPLAAPEAGPDDGTPATGARADLATVARI
ncbi:MAG TPA: tRNA (adenosine(37)-N6)-threonylcarbamoyltransferase complex dimerization subunit type 1 TsaB, partial [Amaricoccus sp.]|nr:tRNA (adenosine(37)-N6)-threonylcarbamoyltransferase complex dimerization subunit type 1 TsaB [Amaricoccus sp.]